MEACGARGSNWKQMQVCAEARGNRWRVWVRKYMEVKENWWMSIWKFVEVDGSRWRPMDEINSQWK